VTQRKFYHNTITSLQSEEVLVVVDYKENLKYNRKMVESSQSFFNYYSATCLGFLVVKRLGNGSLKKFYCCCLSEILNHEADFTIFCLEKVIKMK
jgi:hypothetical protein